MFSTKDIANLKEVVHNQGSWDNHTHITIEHPKKNLAQDGEAIQEFTKLLSDAISIQRPGKCYIAKKDQGNAYSTFQLIENSCIAGDFSTENPKSSVEIFSSKKLNLEEVLRITREFFKSDGLQVTTFQKLGN
jgi:hypothetical protein